MITALCGKDDVIFCDRENHASILDGCRQTFAETKKFRHNDIEDLEGLLQKAASPRPLTACSSSSTARSR